ncbi:MAG: carboxymuconolactone decarboxylase family protein [Roseibium sp.]|nr:carboxymuconolactone decarboxylase family protein [Roseibium sp.]
MLSDTSPTKPQTVEEVERALENVRAKRGYLLPHHGLLAVSAPGLLTAYDATYTEMTLKPRAMTEREKEIVWLIVLVSTKEAIATHHIDRLIKGGGKLGDVSAALALSAWADGAGLHRFVGDHWGPHLDQFDAVTSYRNGLASLLEGTGIEPWIAEVGLAAAHQCHRRWDWVAEHIRGAYREGASEDALAEGLSLAMFPGGVPNFVDACDLWRELISNGDVDATPPYAAWARLTGQGGFDEAAGLTQE